MASNQDSQDSSTAMWAILTFILGVGCGVVVSLLYQSMRTKETQKNGVAAVCPSPSAVPECKSKMEEEHVPAEPPRPKAPETTAVEHETTMTPEMRDRLMTFDFLSVLHDAEIKKYRFEGETRGIMLNKIRSGSIFEKTGFKDGDIIVSINGIALADIGHKGKHQKELQETLPGAKQIEFKVRRDEKIVKLRIKIASEEHP
jgi:type II secretory pathway component PulC